MSINYSVVEIFTNEASRYKSKPTFKAVIDYIRHSKIASRCMIMKGIEAYFENGEFVTQDILNISYNMPVKIEIVIPTAELDNILPAVDEGNCGGKGIGCSFLQIKENDNSQAS